MDTRRLVNPENDLVYVVLLREAEGMIPAPGNWATEAAPPKCDACDC